MSADIKPRATNRGIRHCPSCGRTRGNRAKACQNKLCVFHRDLQDVRNTVDAVELVSYTDSRMYSVRVKERHYSHRSIVQITDITLLTSKDSTFVSRNAICYVDTCKYDSKDVDISCKHVKGASECQKLAVQLKVCRDILLNMEITMELKTNIWTQCMEHENSVPPVQRINKTTFVVKCTQSLLFPAGRLHVTVLPNSKREPHQLTNAYSCACKKLKISLTEESVVLQRDICDHLMFVLAAILSTPSIQEEFRAFMTDVKMYWTENNKLLIFDNGLLPSEDINTYSEILNLTEQSTNLSTSSPVIDFFPNDPTMVSNFCNDLPMDEENEINYLSLPNNFDDIYRTDDSMHLELSDCNIELLDEFKLTDHIDLGEPDIDQSKGELMTTDLETNEGLTQYKSSDYSSSKHASLSSVINEQVATIAIPSVLIDSSKTDISELLTSVQDIKKKDEFVVMEARKSVEEHTIVSLEFEHWLEYLIERINLSINFDCDDPVVMLSFDVHESCFQTFSDRFTIAQKRRLPTSTTLIKKGIHKNLIQYVWIFYTKHSVKRIFSTKNATIEMEKKFKKEMCAYVSYDQLTEPTQDKKFKKILPKMSSAYIALEGSNNNHRTGFKIGWIPNVFPKSQYGVLNIEFTIGFDN